ncbi:MAG: zinc-binding dehydrogenase [Deltaproteobacteria bacterium]|nr:zinc-binding dehydrogenase [Deltaproteobacteria bacterium]
MKALVFDGHIRLTDLPKPLPQEGEALVRVLMAGICRTDVEITKGYMSFHGVLGHEFVGMVEKGPSPELLGARVVGEINAGCGVCAYCRQGLERHCPDRSVLGILGRNGAMAECLTLPAANLVPVPENVSNEKAAFTEPLAAAAEILEQIKIEPFWRVLVVGDGKLGLLVAMVLRLTACEVLLAGKHPEKLSIFSNVGGSAVLVSDLTGGSEKFDVVVEASGNASGWELAIDRVKPRGIIVLKSTYHGDLAFNTAPLVINEITVVGSRCGRFAPALRLMAQGLVDPSPLISRIFAFAQAEEAFRAATNSQNLKVLLRI